MQIFRSFSISSKYILILSLVQLTNLSEQKHQVTQSHRYHSKLVGKTLVTKTLFSYRPAYMSRDNTWEKTERSIFLSQILQDRFDFCLNYQNCWTWIFFKWWEHALSSETNLLSLQFRFVQKLQFCLTEVSIVPMEITLEVTVIWHAHQVTSLSDLLQEHV